MSEEEKYFINPITRQKILSTKFIVEDYYKKCEEVENKNKVINELLSRIASLEYEVERLTEENLSLKLENKILKSGVENEREYSYGIR